MSRRSRVPLVSVLAAAVLASLAAPAASHAADRFAAPGGAGVACTSGLPCSIETAINSAAANDDVIVATGDYGSVGAPLTNSLLPGAAGVSIRGEAGQPRPRIFTDAPAGGVMLFFPGSEIRHVEIDHQNTSVGRTALFLGTLNAAPAGNVAEDVVVRIRGLSGKACVLTTALLRSSVCWESGAPSPLASAVSINFGGTFSPTATVRNVTAWSNAGAGISVHGGSGAHATLNATNVIAHGGGADVAATADGASTATVALANSNYATRSAGDPLLTTITEPGSGTNQLAAPLLVNPAGGDFHQSLTSPTIDAGADDVANGAADLDGDARPLGLLTDIGADESTAPGIRTDPATAIGFAGATLNAAVNASGAAGTQRWDYGTAPESLTSSTAGTSISGSATTTPSTAIAGLAANTTYYAQAVATNPTGTRSGAIVSFLTPGPPVATTGAVEQVTTTTARLTGTVDPERLAASARFAYGTDPGTLTALTPEQPFPSGDAAVSFSADLGDLAPSTTYYAVARAENDAGGDDGDVASFTTAAVPGPGPGPGPGAPGGDPAAPGAAVASLAGKPKLDGKRAIRARIACAGTGRCTGRLALTYRARRKGRTRTLPAGALTYSVPAGGTASLKLPLSAAARKALARARRLKVTLALTPTGASRPARSQALTLRLKQPKRPAARRGMPA